MSQTHALTNVTFYLFDHISVVCGSIRTFFTVMLPRIWRRSHFWRIEGFWSDLEIFKLIFVDVVILFLSVLVAPLDSRDVILSSEIKPATLAKHGPNHISYLKTFKNCTYRCFVRCASIIGCLPWPKTGATYYHAQLGLTDSSRTINGLVVCNMVGVQCLWTFLKRSGFRLLSTVSSKVWFIWWLIFDTNEGTYGQTLTIYAIHLLCYKS